MTVNLVESYRPGELEVVRRISAILKKNKSGWRELVKFGDANAEKNRSSFQESDVRDQWKGVRSQESGVRSQAT
jgi:hypothetical protein